MKRRAWIAVAAVVLVLIAAGVLLTRGSPPSKNVPNLKPQPTETPYPLAKWPPLLLPVGQSLEVLYGVPPASTTAGFPNPEFNPNDPGPYYLNTAVTKSADSVSTADQLPSSERYFAVYVTIHDVAPDGVSTDVDAIAGATATDSKGKSYPAVPGANVHGISPLIKPGTTIVKDGDLVAGWIIFRVPESAVISNVHIAPKGIYGTSGTWSICGVAQLGNC